MSHILCQPGIQLAHVTAISPIQPQPARERPSTKASHPARPAASMKRKAISNGFDPNPLPPKVQRVRTGCIKCKERRVKCDERKPRCNRCVRIGFQACTYQDLPQRKSSDTPSASSATTLSRQNSTSSDSSSQPGSSSSTPEPKSLLRAQPLKVLEDPATRCALQYMADRQEGTKSARQRLRHFAIPPATIAYVGGSLWIEAQAQMFETEPAFRHLQNAFSILNLATWQPDKPEYQTTYFNSVNKVFELCRKGELVYQDEMMMFCCMVIGVCEFLRTSDVKAAWPHRIAGLKIMDDWSTSLHTLPDKHKSNRLRLMTGMRPAFVCGSMTADSLMASDSDTRKLEHRDATMSQIPPVFSTVMSAVVSLENVIIFWMIPLLRPPSSWIAPLKPSKVSRLLRQWFSAYSFLEQRMPHTQDENTLRMLADLHFNTAQIITRMLDSGPESFLVAADELELVARLLQSLLPILKQSLSDFGMLRGIYQPLGLIAPAFFVIIHADSAALRHEARKFLQELPINEGAWSSTVAGLIADILIPTSSMPSSNPQELPSPTENPELAAPMRLKSASCQFQGTERATVRIVYESFECGDWHVMAREAVITDAKVLRACEAASWPLVATLQSWGYLGTNIFPSPYFHSINMIRDRLAVVQNTSKQSR